MSPPVAVKLTSAGRIVANIGPLSGHGVVLSNGVVSISPGSALVTVNVPVDVVSRPAGKNGFNSVTKESGTEAFHSWFVMVTVEPLSTGDCDVAVIE